MKIYINGVRVDCGHKIISYDDVIGSAGYEKGQIVSVTWSIPKSKLNIGGILSPGKTISAKNGMVFNAMITDNS